MALASPAEPTLSLHILQEGPVSVPVRQLWVHLRGHCGVAEEVSGAVTCGQELGAGAQREGGHPPGPRVGSGPGALAAVWGRARGGKGPVALPAQLLLVRLREGGGFLSLGRRRWEGLLSLWL